MGQNADGLPLPAPLPLKRTYHTIDICLPVAMGFIESLSRTVTDRTLGMRNDSMPVTVLPLTAIGLLDLWRERVGDVQHGGPWSNHRGLTEEQWLRHTIQHGEDNAETQWLSQCSSLRITGNSLMEVDQTPRMGK